MAEKQFLALSGKSRGVLRLEYGRELGYAVESPAYLRGAELWLLFSDDDWSILSGCQGECPLPQRRIQAAAVAREGAFVMTGGRADFTAAKSACFTRQEKARLKALEVQAVARASTQRAAQEAWERQEQVVAQERGQERMKAAAKERAQAEAVQKWQEQAETVWKKASIPRPAEPMRVQVEREEEAFSLPVPEVVSGAALRELRRAAEPEQPEEGKEEAPEAKVTEAPEAKVTETPEAKRTEAREQPKMRQEQRAADGREEAKMHREERAVFSTELVAEERVSAEAHSEQPVKPPSARRGLFPALEEAATGEPQKNRPQRAAEKSEKAPRVQRCFERKESQVAPFPKIFPLSRWKKIEYPAYPGRGHYLMGEIYQGQACAAKALAVPGRYALNPPAWLKGFETYLEDGEGQGYWLLFQDEAGKALPIAQVFRDLAEEC